MRRSPWAFDLAVLALAVVVKAVTPPRAWVEVHYSNGCYPGIDRAVRSFTGLLPFCLGDVLFFALLAIALVWLFRTLASSRDLRTLLHLLTRSLAILGLIFLWFLFSWGYNYSRIPLADKIPVHRDRITPTAVAAYADRVADQLSRYAGRAHRERLTDAALNLKLLPTFTATIRRLGDATAFAPPRVKPTVFQGFMALSGTTGFTDPWTHEVNLDAGALPFERPALYAHEWGHIAGFADESEANFISAIACTTASDPLVAYSGWLLIWFNLPSDVHVRHRLAPLARADVRAILARFRRAVNPEVERAQQAAYDRYLRANSVAAGIVSYRLFVRWLTGADYDSAGLPVVVRRGAS